MALLAGCSNQTPMPGENGPSATVTPSATAPPMTTSSGLPGLTTECTQAINAQVAISTLFAEAVAGKAKPLTAERVSTTFAPLTGNVPRDLVDDVEVLHQAATASVGKQAAAVADTLNSSKVSAAMAALNDYVKNCTPTTS